MMSHRTFRACAVTATLIGLVFSFFAPAAARAQDDEERLSAQLLFEPRPIPAPGASEPAFMAMPAPAMESGASPGPDMSAQQAELDVLLAIDETVGTVDERIQHLRALGSIYQQLGRREEADETQSRILTLVQTQYGENSPEAMQALQNLGEWHLEAFFDRSSISLNVPRLNVTNYLINGWRTNSDLSSIENPNNSPVQNLYYAKANFLMALSVLARNNNVDNPALYQLERQFQTVLFLSTQRENIIYEPDFYLTRRASKTGSRLNTRTQNLNKSPDYDDGSVSFKRIFTYIDQNRARTPEQIITTLLEEADWDLLFARPDKAGEKYDSAFQYFDETPVLVERASALIYPEIPVVLPTFLPPPNSREKLGIAPEQSVNYIGYFDVSFAIGKGGRSNNVKMLGQGGQVTEQMQVRLQKYLGNVYFRPRYKGAQLDTEPLRLRYYIGY